MKSELKEVSQTVKELIIEIDAATLKDAYAKVSRSYSKRASVPGFRKGYAPLDVVRLRFKNEIRGDVLQEVVPNAVANAIREHELRPLVEPHLHIDNQESVVVNGSRPLTLHAHVEVLPEIPEPRFEGVEIVRRVKPVSDDEVDTLIVERQKREAALIPVEGRASEIGDTVIVDLEGRFDDQPDGDPINANDLEIVLGDDAIERSFSDNLVGVREEEAKSFTVTYSDDFSSEALAGKTVHYDAAIKSVGRVEMPESSDEWAKSLEEGFESLADLRQRLKSDLEIYSETEADARVRNDAVMKMIDDHAFEVPLSMIEVQTRNLLNEFARDMQQRGVDLNKVDENFVQLAYENMRTRAERDVRGGILLDKVAEMEGVEVTAEEIDEEIAKLAGYYNADIEDVRASYEKQGSEATNSIKHNIRTRKTIEALVSKVKVTDGEWIDPTAPVPEAASKPVKAKGKKSAEPKGPEKKAAKKG